MTQINHLVVYGTLKKGGRLCFPLDKFRKSSTACEFRADMYSIRDSYPGIVNINTADRTVVAEVHEFAPEDMDKVLRIADNIEGYFEDRPAAHNLYLRARMLIKKDGKTVPAYVYTYNQPLKGHKIVADGNWNID